MKHFLLSSLLFAFSSLADGTFYINKSNGLTIEDVVSNTVQSIPSIVGKTYTLDNKNISFVTSTNNDATVLFSNGLVSKLNDNSRLIVNSFEQKIANIDGFPETIRYTDNHLHLSLSEGELECVASNSNTTIDTFLVSINLENGSFYIKSDDRNTTIAVISGEASVSDSLSKKQAKVKAGSLLVVVPAPKMTGRAAEVYKKQNLFTTKDIEADDLKSFSNSLNNLKSQNSNVKFVVIDKKIVGVKIN